MYLDHGTGVRFLAAEPRFTFHLKHGVLVGLPAADRHAD
jgi:hypothetical protein